MKNRNANSKARYRSYLKDELEAASLYYALADAEEDDGRREMFRELAQTEMRHAAHWASRVGVSTEGLRPSRPSLRTRIFVWVARTFGTRAVLPWLLRGEFADIRTYAKEPAAQLIVKDEREHAQMLNELAGNEGSVNLLQSEGYHRAGQAANIRAAVLGGNDGLVSNFALTMGVAGGTPDTSIVLLAGLAGLLAGAFSMAAGEYVSVRAQRDVYDREMEIERAELEEFPEQEKEELVLIYESKGLTKQEAEIVADRILADPQVALDTMAREELGFDPSQVGSPWGVALSSFFAFSVGAIVPVLPYLFISGSSVVLFSTVSSAAALSLVGGTLAMISNKNVAWGSLRMLLIGSGAAAVTYLVGRLVGVSLA